LERITSLFSGRWNGQIEVPDDFDQMGGSEVEKLFEGDE
jgi:hypothetical protein